MTSEHVTDLTRGVYRRLYGGFITGQRINKLSLSAEAWFWRVFVAADDFGNGRADPELCRSATAGNRRVTARQVSGWLREMRDVGLLEFYSVKGEPFFHIVGFEENQPAGKNGKRLRRYPTPDESGEFQVNPDSSSASDNDPHSDTEDHSDSDNDPDTDAPPFHGEDFVLTLADFEKHRKEIRKPLKPTGRRQLYKQLEVMGELAAIQAMRRSIANGWQGVFEQNGARAGPSKADGSLAAARRVAAKYEQRN